MRRDLVEAVLAAASSAVFEGITYTPPAGVAVFVSGAIAGVEIAAERFDMVSQSLRDITHTTRALKAKLPGLAKGALIDDGDTTYRVLDIQPVGDGRFEVELSLRVA